MTPRTSRTPRGAAVFALLFVAGCRAVLGIEDLTLVDGGGVGGDAGSDGASDAAMHNDSAADAPHAPPCGNTTTRPDCGMCCTNAGGPAIMAFTGYVDQVDSCVCGACSGPCPAMQKVCGGGMSAMGTMCIGCAAGTLIDNRCPTLTGKCTGDNACKALADCMATCKQLP